MSGASGSRAAVLGSPIAHSLSPVLHRAAYAAMGLTGRRYDAYECREDGLAGFLDGLDEDWAGLSLTMPLKRVALALADECSPLALAVGGANTLILRDGRRFADNTDVHGVVAALGEAGFGVERGAVVLGGGATAASTLVALRELGLTGAVLAVRNPARAAGAAEAGKRAGLRVAVAPLAGLAGLLADRPLVISTLPGGAGAACADDLPPGTDVFDVTYSPWPTPLAAAAEAAGGRAAGGFGMLLHQAARQVTLMTGREDVPVEAMRAAGERALAGAGNT